MEPVLSDPKKHLPIEVSPGVSWADPKGFVGADPSTATAVLPPRRKITGPAHDAPEEALEVGLRIDFSLKKPLPAEAQGGLLVQEISGKVIRIDQVDTPPPRVEARVKFHPRAQEDSVSKGAEQQEGEWGQAKSYSMRWMVGIGVTVATLIIATLMLLPVINAPNAVASNPTRHGTVVENEKAPQGVEAMNSLLPRRAEAVQIIRSFAQASHVDEIIPLIFQGRSTKEILRKHWHPINATKRWDPSETANWGATEAGGKPLAVLSGTFPDSSNFEAYFIEEDGHLMLDWKATTGFSTATFEELENRQGDSSEVRGEISMSDYYSSLWPEKDYQSYRLVAPDGKNSIWCYAPRGSGVDRMITSGFAQGEIIQKEESSYKITAKLEPGHEGTLPNQWLIVEMLHIDWLTQ